MDAEHYQEGGPGLTGGEDHTEGIAVPVQRLYKLDPDDFKTEASVDNLVKFLEESPEPTAPAGCWEQDWRLLPEASKEAP